MAVMACGSRPALLLAAALSVSSLSPLVSSQNVISTIAGTNWIFRGDGGPALSAPLEEIPGLIVDPAGNLFAADSGNRMVFKITPSGVLTVIAGNGFTGFSGDGGPATSAALTTPMGLARDTAGNLFMADGGRIRQVRPDGTIVTVAGGGSFSPGDGRPATQAALGPRGVAVDGNGNLYIVESGNARIRKVRADGIISTVAGGGTSSPGDGGPATSAAITQPLGVAADAAGNVYFTDIRGLRKIAPDGTLSTVAVLGALWAVTLDATGRFYVSQYSPHRILRVAADGTTTVVAGTGTAGYSGDGGPAAAATLNDPRSVAVDVAGNVYFGDTQNQVVRKVSTDGNISTIAGNRRFHFSGDGGPATSASVNVPQGAALDGAGNMYIADLRNHRIRKVSADGTMSTLAGTGLPGYSGDNGPALAAQLSLPQSVAADTAGNVYLADGNNRVRKVDLNGTITTVAGGGAASPGDGGPATSAALNFPMGVALDPSGNLYVSEWNGNRVRKVASGTITTVAGNGVAGVSGDGGAATSAMLNKPRAVAADGSGNLYIADADNNRIRKISSTGTITTLAGNGTSGSSGDGGAATSASLASPRGVGVDGGGNVFIAEYGGSRVRKVSPAGIISTVAGNGVKGFAGDGGPATAARLGTPNAVTADALGNLYIADAGDVFGNNRIRKVLAQPPAFSLAPATLSFTAAAGAPVVAAQQIAVLSAVTGLGWTASASTETGGAWLSVAPASGAAPGLIAVSANVASLSPGTYRGTVTVQAPVAATPTLSVAVDLTVQGSVVPKLVVEPLFHTFEATAGGSAPPAQTLRISNAGSGTLSWTAQVSTASGGNWLSLSSASGSASGSSPASIQVSVNPAGLAAGVYPGTIRLEVPGTTQVQNVAVTLLLSQAPQTILVSQSGLLFVAVEGGATAPAQSFGIRNTGQGVMNWTAEAKTLSGGGWLSVSPSQGTSDATSLQVPQVEVAVNTTGLRAGQYSGLLQINALAANNSPQFVTVDLNVLPAGSTLGAVVRPTGLIFTVQAGTSSPGSQTVRLATAKPGNVEVRTGIQTEGGDWLEILPVNLVLSPADPRAVVVQPSLGTLTAGVYRGTLTLQFGDGSPSQQVNILLIVTPAGTSAGFAPRDGTVDPTAAGRAEAGGCAPQKLVAVHRALGNSFASPVSWPAALEVQVADDCGSAVPNATVLISFSNGDAPLVLTSLQNGIYVGTWKPVNVSGSVVVTLRATLPPLAPAQAQVQGSVNGNPNVPVLFGGGIVNAASYAAGQALAPGTIISLFGLKLATVAGSNQLPLPKTLGGATLTVGGVEAPLFYSSDGQLNAQLPFELPSNTRVQVVVRTRQGTGGEVVTVPEMITLAAVRPGIFTLNQQGNGQGAIVDTKGRFVDSAAAAAVGDVVQVYATGLGATKPAVFSGQAPPTTEPLARVTTPVEARVGGKAATVHFAGLAPYFVGLYQVNVEIPSGVQPGSAVELVLMQGGVPSNTVTLAIR